MVTNKMQRPRKTLLSLFTDDLLPVDEIRFIRYALDDMIRHSLLPCFLGKISRRF